MRITYDSVERVDRGDQSLWRIHGTITNDDGTTSAWLHALPVDAMEWRAAEYGIDPTDTATLVDVVMAEPHLTPDDWSQGYQLHYAPDVATARRDHLARCARVIARHRLPTRAKGGPLGRLVESPMNPDAVAVKAEHVRRARELVANRTALVAAGVDEAARVANLRRRLLGEG